MDTLEPIDEAIEYDPEARSARSAEGDAAAAAQAMKASDDRSRCRKRKAKSDPAETQPPRTFSIVCSIRRAASYAFPTDVATFHVFDADARLSSVRPFASRLRKGFPVALSQYAPGKEVWIGNKLWTSGAIYSPMGNDRYRAWRHGASTTSAGLATMPGQTTLRRGRKGRDEDCDAWAEPAHSVQRRIGCGRPDSRIQLARRKELRRTISRRRAMLRAPSSRCIRLR